MDLLFYLIGAYITAVRFAEPKKKKKEINQ